jgi:DNA-directed RNA polymerase alpha subunit
VINNDLTKKAIKENIPIAELEYLGLPLRVINALEDSKHNLIYIKDLVSLNEKQISSIENLGSSGVKQIVAALEKLGDLDKEIARWHR